VDVLSDVLTILRSGSPRSARIAWHAPWGQRFPSASGSAAFHVVLQGSCWLLPPTGDPIALGVGDVVFLPRGSGYALADDLSTPLNEPTCQPMDDAELFVSDFIGQDGPLTATLVGGYRLDPEHTHPLMGCLPEVIHLPARLGCHPDLRAVVELLGNEITSPRHGGETAVPALLDLLLLYILRTWFERTDVSDLHGWAAALGDPAIRSALHVIHRTPDRPWTVQTLADEAKMSRATFSRRFAELTGQPPLTYLGWWRLTVAARLLRHSDDPLNKVAASVGYTSEFAFANAFKRRYGIAPGRYRRAR
jgi:AraC-like DNA-binding protein